MPSRCPTCTAARSFALRRRILRESSKKIKIEPRRLESPTVILPQPCQCLAPASARHEYQPDAQAREASCMESSLPQSRASKPGGRGSCRAKRRQRSLSVPGTDLHGTIQKPSANDSGSPVSSINLVSLEIVSSTFSPQCTMWTFPDCNSAFPTRICNSSHRILIASIKIAARSEKDFSGNIRTVMPMSQNTRKRSVSDMFRC